MFYFSLKLPPPATLGVKFYVFCIRCKNMDVMSKVLCREWPSVIFENRNHAVFDEFIHPCLPSQNNIWLEGDWQWSRTSCVWSRGNNCWLCSPCCWPKSHPATQVQTFYNTLSFPPTQFTICSSATTDAFLTNLIFFQILRHSEDPWITFYLFPQPGNEDPIFKITVKVRCKLLNS